MQLFAKSKANKGGAPDFSPWHPNFRNSVELPDTKTVRTRFFVNAAAVAFALCGAVYYAYSEYEMGDVSTQLQSFEERIANDSAGSKEAIAQYKNFKAEEAKGKEFTAFVGAEKLVFSDFMLTVGETLPPEVVITGIQYGRGDVVLRGFVRGNPEEASGIASAYEKHVRENAVISAKFESIALSNLVRDQREGVLNFELVMRFRK